MSADEPGAPGDDGVRDQLQRLASIVGNWGFVAETYRLDPEDLRSRVGAAMSKRSNVASSSRDWIGHS